MATAQYKETIRFIGEFAIRLLGYELKKINLGGKEHAGQDEVNDSFSDVLGDVGGERGIFFTDKIAEFVEKAINDAQKGVDTTHIASRFTSNVIDLFRDNGVVKTLDDDFCLSVKTILDDGPKKLQECRKVSKC